MCRGRYLHMYIYNIYIYMYRCVRNLISVSLSLSPSLSIYKHVCLNMYIHIYIYVVTAPTYVYLLPMSGDRWGMCLIVLFQALSSASIRKLTTCQIFVPGRDFRVEAPLVITLTAHLKCNVHGSFAVSSLWVLVTKRTKQIDSVERGNQLDTKWQHWFCINVCFLTMKFV